MAAYPYTAHLLESEQQLESGYQDDFDQSGGQHARAFHSKQYYRFKLVHFLTLAQFNSLLSTYAAGPRSTYTLTYHSVSPSVTYSVIFVAPPVISDNLGNGYFKVAVNLRGYQD